MEHLTEQQEKVFNKVFRSVSEMKDGEIKILDKTHVGYANFVQCCKHIIDFAHDWNNGFVLTFNSAYSKIQKDNRTQFPNKTTEK